MGQGARPHDVRVGGVVLRLLQGDGGSPHHLAHQRLAQGVGEGHILGVGEIALKHMGEDVRGAIGLLLPGHGKGEGRVHDGQLGPDQRASEAPFQGQLIVGDNAGVAALAAGGGQGGHSDQLQRLLRDRLGGIEVPKIPLIGHAHRDGLGAVHGAGAPQTQDGVRLHFPGQLNPLIDRGGQGVGHDAGQFPDRNAMLLQGGLHPA